MAKHKSDGRFISLLIVVLLSACASSHVMIGKARPPITPDSVQIYMQPPAGKYEQIAILNTSSAGSFSFTAQSKTDSVIKRLKEQAARLGANGVILQGMGDVAGGSVGVGGGQDSYSRSSAVGVGLGGSFQMSHKAGSGLAIYVASQ
jgi:hypothetical protein